MQSKELKKKSEVLLNCPFCGGKAHIEEHKFWDEKAKGFTVQTYGVVCDNCCSMSWQHHRHKEKAIEQWNTRKPMERILTRLEERRDTIYPWDEFETKNHLRLQNEELDIHINIVKEEGGIDVF
jgi:Lar family restriction alleviation protein